MISFKFDNYT